MDPPKFFLNPDAAPFLPNPSGRNAEEEKKVDTVSCDSKNRKSTKEHQTFDPASKPRTHSAEKLEVSGEGYQRRIAPTSEAKDNRRQYNTVGTENQGAKDHVPPHEKMRSKKQDMRHTCKVDIEILSSLFPNFSLQSITDVYNLSGNDPAETILALEDLEGTSSAGHSTATASSSSRAAKLPDKIFPWE